MTKRTDPHRPAAMIPAHYEHVLFYSGAHSDGGWPMPSCGINCELDGRHTVKDAEGNERTVNGKHREDGMCCIIGLGHIARVKFAEYGGTCKCTVCGAAFIHGQVWRHTLTGEHIHLGHTCADKYEFLADRSEHELRLDSLHRATAIQCERAHKAEQRAAFLAKHPGLDAALKANHHIVANIAVRFTQRCELSDKQIALVFKIANELANPKPAEVHVPAPEGRVDFQGEVVSVKAHDGSFGITLKMVVKVRTDAGVWLAWMTAPSGVLGDGELRGCTVDVRATLKRGKDAHFAFGKRPIAKVIARPTKADVA